MMRKTRKILMLIMALLFCFVLLSCSKKEEKKSDYERIKKETKKLRVLISPENPPFEYKADGQIVGADIALIKKIAGQLGVDYELIETNYGDLIDQLIEDNGDIVVSAYIYNNERKGASFSTIYLDNSLALVIKQSDDSIQSVDDLEGKIVAVQENSQSDFYISDFQNLKNVERCAYVSDCMTKMNDGEVDAVICDINTATYYLKNEEGKYRSISLRDTLEKYVVVVREDSDLLNYVNEAIGSFKYDEDIEAVITEHTVHTETISPEDQQASSSGV